MTRNLHLFSKDVSTCPDGCCASCQWARNVKVGCHRRCGSVNTFQNRVSHYVCILGASSRNYRQTRTSTYIGECLCLKITTSSSSVQMLAKRFSCHIMSLAVGSQNAIHSAFPGSSENKKRKTQVCTFKNMEDRKNGMRAVTPRLAD